MKNRFFKSYCLILLALFSLNAAGQSWIRVNQLGYLPGSVKVAVFISTGSHQLSEFRVCESLTGKIVFKGKPEICSGSDWGMKSAARLDFSSLRSEGGYYISLEDTKSDFFRISNSAYKGTADFILKYMRQQQCGYNPFLKDSCHTHDGFIVDHPSKTGKIIDVKGGWHDASDYLQYVTTSANAVYQMLYAYLRNPEVYGDSFDASGNKGENGIPDILDEARWGIDWLLKMNPEKDEMYNQIADDRDHRGFRLPTLDTTSYGFGPYRPVYFVTGKPQGLAKFKNRTTGVSSTAGKYSSAFALGSVVFKKTDPALASKLATKAQEAWSFGLSDLGVTQTACNVSPYFYEEDNYADDLELAAWELYRLTGDKNFLQQADYWGSLEPVTPWIEKDTARHYQSYPFVNMGHPNIGLSGTEFSSRYCYFMKKGLQIIDSRRPGDPFRVNVPFTWCSNNFIVAAWTQHRLYREATNDSSFIYFEAALRDWLFGCNPWGVSMICGLPAGSNYPHYPHSAIALKMGITTEGGLIDGPVYSRIYTGLKGISLMRPDTYSVFQNGKVVYHDDIGDYSTNEPTMDGTASLSFMLSSLEVEGRRNVSDRSGNIIDQQGAMIKKNISEKEIYLIFSADEFGEGADHILNVLSDKKIKGSFFLTGNFLRNQVNKNTLKRIISDNHFIGPHSDKHLLYIPWENRDTLLISRDTFISDLKSNYAELVKAGARVPSKRYFLAPYEWYNSAISKWSADLGITLINLTPGSGTNADYTTPYLKNYVSSDQLLSNLKSFEKVSQNGLNGNFILIHLGTAPERTDKFYNKLSDLIDYFSDLGYKFNKL